MQKCIQDSLAKVEFTEGMETVTVCGNELACTEEVRKAHAEIMAVQACDSQVPLYT